MFAGWNDIDNQPDKEKFIRFLEQTRDSSVSMYQNDLDKYYGFLDLKEDESILDVGCGLGFDCFNLARYSDSKKLHLQITGIDNSKTMIEGAKAKQYFNQFLPTGSTGLYQILTSYTDIDFQVSDICKIDTINKTQYALRNFDVIFSRTLFQHLEDPYGAFLTMFHILNERGRICIIDTDWNSVVPPDFCNKEQFMIGLAKIMPSYRWLNDFLEKDSYRPTLKLIYDNSVPIHIGEGLFEYTVNQRTLLLKKA